MRFCVGWVKSEAFNGQTFLFIVRLCEHFRKSNILKIIQVQNNFLLRN